jgi:hypothetical protein
MIYRIAYCVIAGFGILFMTGFFSVGGSEEATFAWADLFYYYTNLSNMLCLGIMVVVLAANVKRVRRGEVTGHNEVLQPLKYFATIIIMVTFLVYAVLLGEPFTLHFWNNIANLCYHVVAPVMFILDWFLFDRHKSVSVLDPILSLILPLCYVAVIEVMGIFSHRFPYFFLNADNIGIGGVIGWVAILLVIFLVLGYVLFFYDKLVKKDGKWQFDFSEMKLAFFAK